MALRQTLLPWAAALFALCPLVACHRSITPPIVARNALADSADQVLYHTKSVLTDNGVMKAEVHADTGYLFDDNTRVEMRVVQTVFFTATGARNAVLTSREGTYNTRTNNMEARGDVVVVSEDGRHLTTQELRYGQTRNEIMSDSAFVLTDSTQKMTGIGFVSDPNMNNVRCLKKCAGSAGMVTLPGEPGDTVRVAPPAHPHRDTLPGNTLPSAGLPPGGPSPSVGTPVPAAGAPPATVGAPPASSPRPSTAGTPVVTSPAAATPAATPAGTPPAATPPAVAPPAVAPPAGTTPDTLHARPVVPRQPPAPPPSGHGSP